MLVVSHLSESLSVFLLGEERSLPLLTSREIGGCEIHLSRSSAARTWRCRLVQNPRFCGWRLKPGVQAWVPAYAHGPTRGGNGHRPISTQQCKPDCCIAWCLPPWGGRTSAEPELGLGPQHWPSGIPTTVGTPDTHESLDFVQFSKLIIQAGAASQARCASPQGLSALRVRCCRSPTNAAHRSDPHVVALHLRCASFAASSLFTGWSPIAARVRSEGHCHGTASD